MSALHGFLFQVYPYVCLTVFLLGSLIRFDQNQYTWKSDSSQLLRAGMPPRTMREGASLEARFLELTGGSFDGASST